MRLHVAVGMLGGERAGHLHLLGRRGDGEARRDGVERAALAVPCGDQRLGVVIAGLRRVAQPVGRVAVHHHLAGDDPACCARRLGEEGFGRCLVHRAIGGDRRRAVADHLVEEQPRDAAAMLRVGELRLFGKGVGVQPVEQFGAVGGDHLHLRKMHMRVDEAGQHQMRPVVDRFRRLRRPAVRRRRSRRRRRSCRRGPAGRHLPRSDRRRCRRRCPASAGRTACGRAEAGRSCLLPRVLEPGDEQRALLRRDLR